MGLTRNRPSPLRDELIGKLKSYLSGPACPGNGHLPCEQEMARQFDVSRKTMRAALDVLESQSLVQRIRGKGTFKTSSSSAMHKIIYYLVPCDDFSVRSGLSSGTLIKQMLSSLIRACAGLGCRIVPIPFSRTNRYDQIDYEALSMIEPGSNVVVHTMWYRNIFKFLYERNCNVAFLYTQNFKIHYSGDDEFLPYTANWHHFQLDRVSAVEESMRVLSHGGCRNPFLAAPALEDMTNMYLPSYLNAGGKEYWSFSKEFKSHEEFVDRLSERYEQTGFDGLLVNLIYSFEPDYRYSLNHNLKLSEDVKIITLQEYEMSRLFRPQVPFITFDYYRIGREIVEVLLGGSPGGERRKYEVTSTEYHI